MDYVSTRDKNGRKYTIREAILMGLAPDGGLFVPESFPAIPGDFTMEKGFAYSASQLLYPYFEGDLEREELEEICRDAFNFPLSMPADGNKATLELFWGPTCAFKDFGARFLACYLERHLEKNGGDMTILVATSGDTGGAVASAFHGRRHIEVKVVFPKDRVSERQKQQLTCWDGNISSFEVEGSFDDCQKMVKQAFMDGSYGTLSSANSINIARLLPQMTYYVYSSFLYKARYGMDPVFIIPSGNVGNSTGCCWAREMGAPISGIVLAVNANRTVPDYIESGVYEPRQSIHTLANAMDVGAPSNMERLMDLYPTWEDFKDAVSSYSVNDYNIRLSIKQVYEKEGRIICPHTACGEYVRHAYFEDKPTVVVATAHPAKFEHIVEPMLGVKVPIPESLYKLFELDSRYWEISANYKALFD